MWTSDGSILQFVREAPSNIHYLFASYGRERLASLHHHLHQCLCAPVIDCAILCPVPATISAPTHVQKESCKCLNTIVCAAVDALRDVMLMRDRMLWAMDEVDLKQSKKQEWLSHLHFAKLPLSGLSDVGANFIPYLVRS